MKHLYLVIIIIFFGLNDSWAQCNPFFNFKEGAQWEMTSYNANDKVTSRQVNEIKSIEKTPNGWKALINFKSFDKKDKLDFEKDVELECANGIFIMDMERFMPEEALQSFKDMDMKIEAENLEWPSNLEVGKSLEDGAVTISGDMINISVNIINRKVEGRENITTPAGTFDSYKITYDVSMKMMMNINSKGVDYIAKDVGLVRSESYNGNGKLMGYTLLTNHK